MRCKYFCSYLTCLCPSTTHSTVNSGYLYQCENGVCYHENRFPGGGKLASRARPGEKNGGGGAAYES